MSGDVNGKHNEMQIEPIGHVRRTGAGEVFVEILATYRAGLKQLDRFSHVIVLWWADRSDNPTMRGTLQCNPPYATEHTTGVFACRAEYRPNPIAVTTCEIVAVDEAHGIVRLRNIDALDGSPVLDLKAYFPVVDRVQDAHIPGYLTGWPEWLPESGIGLEEG